VNKKVFIWSELVTVGFHDVATVCWSGKCTDSLKLLARVMRTEVQCVSKRIPDSIDYSLKKYYQILIIFSTNIPDIIPGHQMTSEFPTSANVCICTTWGKHNKHNTFLRVTVVPAGTAVLAMGILSVCPFVWYRIKRKWDRDSGFSPYDSLGSVVSNEVIWCRWVRRFSSNERGHQRGVSH